MKKLVPFVSLVIVLTVALAGCVPQTTPSAPAQSAQPTAAPPPTAAPVTLVMVTNMDDVVTLDPHHAYETTNLMIHN